MTDDRFPRIIEGDDPLPFSPFGVALKILVFAGLFVAATSVAAIVMQVRHDAGIEASQ